MLFFRDEEHVARWCRQWRMAEGAVLSRETGWDLAAAWFRADRGAPEWRRPPVDEVDALFGRLGLGGSFWSLR